MIVYFMTAAHTYTLRGLEKGDPDLFARVRVIPYERLLQERRVEVPRGVYLFTDIERIPPGACARLAGIHRQLQARSGDRRVCLNHPTLSLRRYELLRRRFLQGQNRFNLHRLTEHAVPARWPVFVRNEHDHKGAVSPLLHDLAELEAYTRQLREGGQPVEDKVAIEFLDTADEAGVYRKYSVFRIGDRLIPRHLFFSHRWMLKEKDLLDEAQLAEELAFLRDFPYRDQVWEAFEQARIDYGRIDFSVLDGRLQVWEINTNPYLHPREPTSEADDPRHRAHLEFLRAMSVALLRLDPTEAG